MKFETGPARATIYRLFLPLMRFSIITGTGFAHPIPIRRMAKVPIKSKCLSGLRVSLPCLCAVLSPNIRAAKPWLYSWTLSENKTIGIITNSTSRLRNVIIGSNPQLLKMDHISLKYLSSL